ncbi:NAD(P)/FAD-dependent oxidoreductase [Paenibacillus sp. MER TA 81-3]|uniref:flavin-containing monooxygenase n=1 Tax=Paenibacillus sp. MER TA 81-3 TaxID=2939573 RepID=UPI00203B6332|nr:NAD(P)-binding domain-containing protein [Paenibacillus sp. MER TA 81-3]MCM3338866.1 NAD(P)/FAD-dependent oxidoreductase [Paenibacillus sp. MER TA 81-3]
MHSFQSNPIIDVVIIGAGQAGLALGAQVSLLQPRLSTLLLERHRRVGDNWRERYDSLVLFTPRKYSELPGLSMAGDPDGFPAGDEVADYLEHYAKHWQLSVRTGSQVERVEHDPALAAASSASGATFHVYLHGQDAPIRCRRLVLATGPFRTPYVPDWAQSLHDNVMQLHSSQYKRPSQLPSGPVLVVGGGNSGAHIAVELSKSHPTSLAVRGTIRQLPLHILNRSTFEWMDKLTLLHAQADGRRARWLRRKGDPIFGYALREAVRSDQLQLKPEAVGINEQGTAVLFKDRSSCKPATVIWATGFRNDNRWLQLPSLFDEHGQLMYTGHRTPVNGLYVIGMPWQHARSSALLCGAGPDAKRLATELSASDRVL